MGKRSVTVQEMIFWGATGQAKVLRDCMQATGIGLVAVFDNNPEAFSPFEDVPIYHGTGGFQNWMRYRARSTPLGCLVAIGGDKGKERLAIQEFLASQGCLPLVAMHPSSIALSGVTIGEGSQILANATLSVDVRIGAASIVNTAALVDHECRIGAGVHIGPGAHLAGCVEIGDFATVYSGATVIPRIRIGRGAVIGAGSVVIRNVPEGATVVGNPARIHHM